MATVTDSNEDSRREQDRGSAQANVQPRATLPLYNEESPLSSVSKQEETSDKDKEITKGWIFKCTVFISLYLSSVIIGSIYIHDCVLQPKIPIYLIVSGVFGIIEHLFSIWIKFVIKDPTAQNRFKVGHSIIRLFILVWFVLGCFWVYGEYNAVDNYLNCNRTLYLFAFWFLNFVFILLVVSCGLSCGTAFNRYYKKVREQRAGTASNP